MVDCTPVQEDLIQSLVKYHTSFQSYEKRVRRSLFDELESTDIDLTESKRKETSLVLKTSQRKSWRVIDQYKIKMGKRFPANINHQRVNKNKVWHTSNKPQNVKKSSQIISFRIPDSKDKKYSDKSRTCHSRYNTRSRVSTQLKMPTMKAVLKNIMNFEDIYLLMIENSVKTVYIPEKVYSLLENCGSNMSPNSSLKINSFKSRITKKNVKKCSNYTKTKQVKLKT